MALYEVNRRVVCDNVVTLNEFYELLGLEPMPEYEQLGWSACMLSEMYWSQWIDFGLEDAIIEEETEYSEGIECTILHMPMEPIVDYDPEW
jgi:hypothetical protein